MKINKKRASILLLLILSVFGLVFFKGFVVARLVSPDSLIQLIATPSKYHQKQVRVDGFLRVGFEGNALYLHKEDAQFGMTANAVWVEVSDEMCADAFDNKHVYIEGVFNAKNRGHRAVFSGAIEDVSRCYLLENIRGGCGVRSEHSALTTNPPPRGAEGGGGSESSNP